MRIAIVGAGFSGIAAAIELKRAGFEDFTLYERGEDLGGVWHHNTYPGAACDVPSALYSFSYAQRRDWSRPCSPQEEVKEYLRDVAREHGLMDQIRMRRAIASAAWDDEALRWTLETESGERIDADVLVPCCGQLSKPAWPQVEGREDFEGPAFHSAEWDHGCDLRGKRVAVLGTGASAIQFVPSLVEQAAHVDVYQRTPPYLLPRRNRPYPGWLKALARAVPAVQKLRREGWKAYMELGTVGLTRHRQLLWGLGLFSKAFMAWQVRDDRELRRKIWPTYPFGCKRILFSSHYLEALQSPNVELVTDRIARIAASGVETEDGTERRVDCLIYGTGFDTGGFVAPMRIEGAGGQELQEAWADGAEAHLGIAVAGFPNMLLMYGPNTNLGAGSIVEMVESQAVYVADAVRTLRDRGRAALDVRPEVQAKSGADVQQRLRGSVWMECDSWYRDDDTGRITLNWPGTMREYRLATRHLDPAEYTLIGERANAEPASNGSAAVPKVRRRPSWG